MAIAKLKMPKMKGSTKKLSTAKLGKLKVGKMLKSPKLPAVRSKAFYSLTGTRYGRSTRGGMLGGMRKNQFGKR